VEGSGGEAQGWQPGDKRVGGAALGGEVVGLGGEGGGQQG
jgi:hypothetical protein